MPSTHVPLTAVQEGIWLATRADPDETGYHDVVSLRLTGELDPGRLERAGRCAVGHEALRSRVVLVDGAPMQVFDVDRVEWVNDDLRHLGEGAAAAAQTLFDLDATEPFDLGTGPLWRCRLVRTGPREHLLAIVLHHLVADGHSHGVLLRTLASAYLGLPTTVPPGAGYADWVRARVRQEADATVRSGQVAARVAGRPRHVALPGLRHAATASQDATALPLPLPEDWSHAFDRACAAHGVTRFMGLAGLFGARVCELTGTSDVVASMPVAMRHDRATLQLAGCMINVVPLLLPGGGGGHCGLTAGRRAVVEALADVDVPYRDVMRAVGVHGAGSDDPLTELGVEEFNVPLGALDLDGVRVDALPRRHLKLRHSLTLSVLQGSGRPELLYPVDRWDAGALREMSAGLAGAITAASVR